MANKHYKSGWDYVSTKPAEHETLCCRACNTAMEVRRNVNGPTSSIEAMSGGKHLHDAFYCPHAGEDWHTQVIKLRELMLSTPSAKLEAMLADEVAEIIKTRKATKKVSHLF